MMSVNDCLDYAEQTGMDEEEEQLEFIKAVMLENLEETKDFFCFRRVYSASKGDI